ncbi:hypothetical protein Scep_006932 [Stephania cephalantha]|uniref:Uncharacterized protein n=1 Tax=Stephania cephalantha TaxID=152367 RepID=A0AAP0KA42_9MAGN
MGVESEKQKGKRNGKCTSLMGLKDVHFPYMRCWGLNLSGSGKQKINQTNLILLPTYASPPPPTAAVDHHLRSPTARLTPPTSPPPPLSARATSPPLRRASLRRLRRHPASSTAPNLPSFNNLAHKVITHLRNSSIPILPPLQLRFVRAEAEFASPSLPTSAPYSLVGLPISPASPAARPRRLPPPASNSAPPRPPHLHHLLYNQIRPYSRRAIRTEKRRGRRRKGGGGWPAVDDDATLLMVGARCVGGEWCRFV